MDWMIVKVEVETKAATSKSLGSEKFRKLEVEPNKGIATCKSASGGSCEICDSWREDW